MKVEDATTSDRTFFPSTQSESCCGASMSALVLDLCRHGQSLVQLASPAICNTANTRNPFEDDSASEETAHGEERADIQGLFLQSLLQ